MGLKELGYFKNASNLEQILIKGTTFMYLKLFNITINVNSLKIQLEL